MKQPEFTGGKGAFKKLMSVFKDYEISKTTSYILRVDKITFDQTIIFRSVGKDQLSEQDIEKLEELVRKYQIKDC